MNQVLRAASLALAAALPLSSVVLPAPAGATTTPPRAPVARSADGSGNGALDATARTAPRQVTASQRFATRSTRDAALRYLGAHRTISGVASPQSTLRSSGSVTSAGVTAERFDQVLRGVPVLGGQYVVRVRTDAHGSTVIGSGGSYYQGLTVSTTPRVSAARATRAGHLFLARAGIRDAKVSSRGLVVLPVGAGRLAHRVLVSGVQPRTKVPFVVELIVDANNGAVLTGWNRLGFANDPAAGTPVTTTGRRLTTLKVPVNLLQTKPKVYEYRDRARPLAAQGGEIVTYDARGGDVTSYLETLPADATVATATSLPLDAKATAKGLVDAHWAAGQVFDYYHDVLGRNSIDGKGGTMTSVVNVTYGGSPFANAFWDGSKMVFGGGGDGYRPFSAALDVVGHEMTHGVIERTADLLYFGQPGAVNEAIADYFGNAIQNDAEGIAPHLPEATLLGEDLCTTGSRAACATRDLGDKRTTYQDYEGVLGDNAGVHVNSTIVSGALWDIRTRLGGDRTDRLVYTALTQYLTSSATFSDVRTAVLGAAEQLGYSASARTTITNAFDAHGITTGWEKRIGVDSTRLLPGIDYMIFGVFLAAQPEAAGGTWTVADTDLALTGGLGVYGGSTTSAASTKRLSPDDGWWHDVPETDGRSVLWASGNLAGDVSRVYSRDVVSGRTDVIWEGPELIASVGVSGTTRIAATIDPETAGYHLWASIDGEAPRELPLPGVLATKPVVDGTTIAVVVTREDESGAPNQAAYLIDARTGKTTEVPRPASTGPTAAPGAAAAVLTPKALVTVETGDLWSGHYSVVRRPRTGTTLGRPVTVLDGTQEDALNIADLDASDSRVTVLAVPAEDAGERTGLTNATTPKLWQKPVSGGAWQRVSCSRGEQAAPSSDTGSRVVFVDATTGDPAVVTRATPAGSCD